MGLANFAPGTIKPTALALNVLVSAIGCIRFYRLGLLGKVPFGFRRGDAGELVPHDAEQEAIREIVSLRAKGKALRAIAQAVAAKGHKLSHEGVAGVLRSASGA